MSAQDFELDPPGDDLQAAEYVLGVLDTDARRAAQSRIEAEPAFAGLVAEWEQRFASLIAQIDPADVPAHIWPRLRTRLGWSPMEGGRDGLMQSVGFWRGATAAALATAAVLAIVALVRPPMPGPQPGPEPIVTTPTPAEPTPAEPAPASEQPKPVVVLARDDGQPGWLAAVDAAGGAITMVPIPSPAQPDGRVGELWLIPAGGAPQSLGFVSSERAHTVDVPDTLRSQLVAGATLAITLEPEAGIPHAAPTGPIVAKGNIQVI